MSRSTVMPTRLHWPPDLSHVLVYDAANDGLGRVRRISERRYEVTVYDGSWDGRSARTEVVEGEAWELARWFPGAASVEEVG